MTTWCILSSMFRRFKCSKRGLETSLRACVQAEKMLVEVQLGLCARGMIGRADTRLLHSSHQCLNKRLPSGVQQKRVSCLTSMQFCDLFCVLNYFKY